jgi:energy-coupling factor transporter ATP-binding protein EcfA2
MAEEVHKIDSTSSNELMRELLLTRQPASDSDLEPPAGETASPPMLPDDPDHARIHTVTIHNFKSLEDIAFALPEALPPDDAEILTSDSIEPPSAPCLLILGENATGKSSILEAIVLACIPDDLRDALRRPPVGLTARRITLNPEYMGAPGAPPRGSARVDVRFHEREDVARTLGIEVLHDEAANIPDGGLKPFGDTGPARPMIFAYGPNRLYGRHTRPDHTRFIDTLFDSTLHVSNPEGWLISLAKRKDGALDQIAAALRHIIRIDGEFGTIEIAPDPEDGKPRVWINLIRHLPDGATRILRQRLAYASSGYRAVLALVCDVFARLLAQDMTPYEARLSRAIILIDEIEAHLHPRWKLQIIDGLRKALPRATFILTSHDPLCVRGMRAGEVMMLNRHMVAEGAIPEKVERVGDFGAFERMSVEQLLTSDMFQLASVDDPKAEQRYARVADLIADREAGAVLSVEDRATLRAFNDEIVEGMPTGVTEVTNLVQRAVADYLKDRRAGDAAIRSAARIKAEAAVKDFLREMLA